MHLGDHRRQPAAAVLVDGWPRRRSAACRCRCTRTRPRSRDALRAERRRGRASRSSRTRSRSTSCSRSATAVPARSSTSSSTIRAACATTRRTACTASTAAGDAGARITTAHPGFFDDRGGASGGPTTSRSMFYTSGTTGKPKGVCHTHAALIAAARGGVEFDRLTPDEDVLSYLPMAWIGDHIFSLRAVAARRLHDQLPGVRRHGDDRPARDRPDLLFRAAAQCSRAC